MKKSAEYAEAGLSFEFQNEIPLSVALPISEKELFRIVSNLINNSAEALVARHDGKIKLRSYLEDDKSIIEIEDNGPGIPEHLRELVWQKGFSSGKADSVSAGSGLGLFHAKSKIESVGGSIKIARSDSSGTLIRLWFPLCNP